jgi:hypothetical protein
MSTNPTENPAFSYSFTLKNVNALRRLCEDDHVFIRKEDARGRGVLSPLARCLVAHLQNQLLFEPGVTYIAIEKSKLSELMRVAEEFLFIHAKREEMTPNQS